MKHFADTGLIVGLLTRNDPYHAWAAQEFRAHAPFHVCEAVLVEAASFFPDPTLVLRLVERGDLILDDSFSLEAELASVLALAAKYADRPMDLADACLGSLQALDRGSGGLLRLPPPREENHPVCVSAALSAVIALAQALKPRKAASDLAASLALRPSLDRICSFPASRSALRSAWPVKRVPWRSGRA
jgi:predicted nucleic acid-binding protein